MKRKNKEGMAVKGATRSSHTVDKDVALKVTRTLRVGLRILVPMKTSS